MIDANKNERQLVSEIWSRIGSGEKMRIMDKFPDSRNIYSPEVRSYLLEKFRDKIVEVIIK